MASTSKPLDALRGKITDETVQQCMHCGMCLPVCPTYQLTLNERSSPRGRIRLIKTFLENKHELTPLFQEEMNFCLDCQACESACPAGVQYGKIVELTRDHIAQQEKGMSRLVKRFLLNSILAKHTRLQLLSALVGAVQKLFPAQKLRNVTRYFPSLERITDVYTLAPLFQKKKAYRLAQTNLDTEPPVAVTVSFLSGCIMDVAFANVNQDTIDILEALRCRVLIPEGQVCCGALHAHSGEIEKAKELARKNITAFSGVDYTWLIANSAGCGAFMKEYGHLLADEPDYAEQAEVFSAKVLDLSEFVISRITSEQLKSVPRHVTYHDACHLCHTQKISAQPRALLGLIPELTVTELPEASWCCGSAGTYNIERYHDSLRFLERKMENIRQTGASTVVTANPGCMAQIAFGALKYNVDIEVVHTATLLKQALSSAGDKE
jgi:glycolate oxidase iron-sulfur subunit